MKPTAPLCYTSCICLLLSACSEGGDHAHHDHDHSSHTHTQVEGTGHIHEPPNGGMPVVLGDEAYHVEFVLQQTNRQMDAYILDGHMDEYVRLTVPSFEVVAKLPDTEQTLQFQAVTNLATGETVGDTALFRAEADWLANATAFEGKILSLEIRSARFENVTFQFPGGNDPIHR